MRKPRVWGHTFYPIVCIAQILYLLYFWCGFCYKYVQWKFACVGDLILNFIWPREVADILFNLVPVKRKESPVWNMKQKKIRNNHKRTWGQMQRVQEIKNQFVYELLCKWIRENKHKSGRSCRASLLIFFGTNRQTYRQTNRITDKQTDGQGRVKNCPATK